MRQAAKPGVADPAHAPAEGWPLARSIWEAGAEDRRIVERFYDPLARRFVSAMCEALLQADEVRITWVYGWTLGALLTFTADTRIERLTDGRARAADPDLGETLIRFMTRGFLPAVDDAAER